MASDLMESIPVRTRNGKQVARVLLYEDESLRVRLYGDTGFVLEECFLGPSRQGHAILKLRPKLG